MDFFNQLYNMLKENFFRIVLLTLSLTLIIALALTVLTLAGCNYEPIDLTYKYNYAVIELQDGTVIKGKVEGWRDCEGEEVQIKIDGVTYLTSSYNCTLIYDPALSEVKNG